MWKEVSAGPQSFGYYRGTPYYQGSGAGTGGNVAGTGKFAQGQGPVTGAMPDTWNPTILYLIMLVVAEMFVFGWLSRRV